MFSDNVVISWDTIIPMFSVIILLIMIRCIMVKNRVGFVTNQYMAGNYQEVLPKAIKLQNSYGQTLFTKNRNARISYDFFSCIVATIYLHENNGKEFLKYINEIGGKDKQYIKFFWLYVYYLINNDSESALTNYDLLNKLPDVPEMTRIAADALLADYNGNTEEAIKLFAQWMNEDCPKNPILKEILLNRIGDGTQEDEKTGDGSLS